MIDVGTALRAQSDLTLPDQQIVDQWNAATVSVLASPASITFGRAITLADIAAARSTVPVYDGTGTLVFRDDLSKYTDAVAMGAVGLAGPRLVPLNSPVTNGLPVNPVSNQVIVATEQHVLRMGYTGAYQGSCNWLTTGTVTPPINSTHYLTFAARLTFAGPITREIAVKMLEGWHSVSTGTRVQWNTHNHLPWTGGTHRTYFQVYDQAETATQGTQPVPPYFEEDVANGQEHTFAVEYRSNSAKGARDGIARMWIDGIKMIDISASAIGVTPLGGEKVWCNADDVDALANADSILGWRFGSTQTDGPGCNVAPQVTFLPWTYDLVGPITWWAVPPIVYN